jgi:MFS family permease
VLSPLSLTVIMVNFPAGPGRRRAVATWGMVATGGSALGVLLSGLLTEYLDWRWVLAYACVHAGGHGWALTASTLLSGALLLGAAAIALIGLPREVDAARARPVRIHWRRR